MQFSMRFPVQNLPQPTCLPPIHLASLRRWCRVERLFDAAFLIRIGTYRERMMHVRPLCCYANSEFSGFSRATLRQNTAMLAEIGKKGVFK